MAVDEIQATGGVSYAKETAMSLQESVDAALLYFETRMGAKRLKDLPCVCNHDRFFLLFVPST